MLNDIDSINKLLNHAKEIEGNPDIPSERVVRIMTLLSVLATEYRIEAAKERMVTITSTVKDAHYKRYKLYDDMANSIDGQHGLISVLKKQITNGSD